MAIRSFEKFSPVVSGDAWVDDSAVVIGNVIIGEHASIWPQVVIRGDVQCITIGNTTNIQDGAVLHVSHKSDFMPEGAALNIGQGVTVGHNAVLHGCTLEGYCLIGMSSTIMDGAYIETEVLLAAGSLVSPNKRLESGFLYAGSPAKKIRPLTEEERSFIRYSAEHYVKLKEKHRNNSMELPSS